MVKKKGKKRSESTGDSGSAKEEDSSSQSEGNGYGTAESGRGHDSSDEEYDSDDVPKAVPQPASDSDGENGPKPDAAPQTYWGEAVKQLPFMGLRYHSGSANRAAYDPVVNAAHAFAQSATVFDLPDLAAGRNLMDSHEISYVKRADPQPPPLNPQYRERRWVYRVTSVADSGQGGNFSLGTVLVNGHIVLYSLAKKGFVLIPVFERDEAPTVEHTVGNTPSPIAHDVRESPAWGKTPLKLSAQFVMAVEKGRDGAPKTPDIPDKIQYVWPCLQAIIVNNGATGPPRRWGDLLNLWETMSVAMTGQAFGALSPPKDILLVDIHHNSEKMEGQTLGMLQDIAQGVNPPGTPVGGMMEQWTYWDQWVSLWGPAGHGKKGTYEAKRIPFVTYALMFTCSAIADPASVTAQLGGHYPLEDVGLPAALAQGAQLHPRLTQADFPFMAAMMVYPEVGLQVCRLVSVDPAQRLMLTSDPRTGTRHRDHEAVGQHLHTVLAAVDPTNGAGFHGLEGDAIVTIAQEVMRAGAQAVREQRGKPSDNKANDQLRETCTKLEGKLSRALLNTEYYKRELLRRPAPEGKETKKVSILKPRPDRGRVRTREAESSADRDRDISLDMAKCLLKNDKDLLKRLQYESARLDKKIDKAGRDTSLSYELRSALITALEDKKNLVLERASPLVERHQRGELAQGVKELVGDRHFTPGAASGRVDIIEEKGALKAQSLSPKGMKALMPPLPTAVRSTQEIYLTGIRNQLQQPMRSQSLASLAQCIAEAFGDCRDPSLIELSRNMFKAVTSSARDKTRMRMSLVDCAEGMEAILHPPLSYAEALKESDKIIIDWENPQGVSAGVTQLRTLGERVRKKGEHLYYRFPFPGGTQYIRSDPAVDFFCIHLLAHEELKTILTLAPSAHEREWPWTMGALWYEVVKRDKFRRDLPTASSLSLRRMQQPQTPPPVAPMVPYAPQEQTNQWDIPVDFRCTFETNLPKDMRYAAPKSYPAIHDRRDCENLQSAAFNSGFLPPSTRWERPHPAFPRCLIRFLNLKAKNDGKAEMWEGLPSQKQSWMRSGNGGKKEGGKGGGQNKPGPIPQKKEGGQANLVQSLLPPSPPTDGLPYLSTPQQGGGKTVGFSGLEGSDGEWDSTPSAHAIPFSLPQCQSARVASLPPLRAAQAFGGDFLSTANNPPGRLLSCKPMAEREQQNPTTRKPPPPLTESEELIDERAVLYNETPVADMETDRTPGEEGEVVGMEESPGVAAAPEPPTEPTPKTANPTKSSEKKKKKPRNPIPEPSPIVAAAPEIVTIDGGERAIKTEPMDETHSGRVAVKSIPAAHSTPDRTWQNWQAYQDAEFMRRLQAPLDQTPPAQYNLNAEYVGQHGRYPQDAGPVPHYREGEARRAPSAQQQGLSDYEEDLRAFHLAGARLGVRPQDVARLQDSPTFFEPAAGADRHRRLPAGLPQRNYGVEPYGQPRHPRRPAPCFNCGDPGHKQLNCPHPLLEGAYRSPMRTTQGPRERQFRQPAVPQARQPTASPSPIRSQANATEVAKKIADIVTEVQELGRTIGIDQADAAIRSATGWTTIAPATSADAHRPIIGTLLFPLALFKKGQECPIPEFVIEGVSVAREGATYTLFRRDPTRTGEPRNSGAAYAPFIADANQALIAGMPHAPACPQVGLIVSSVPVNAVLDTGATSSFVDDALYCMTKGRWPWARMQKPLPIKIADGSVKEVCMAAEVTVTWNGITRRTRLMHMEGLPDRMLLGMESVREFGGCLVYPNPLRPEENTAVPANKYEFPELKKSLLPDNVTMHISRKQEKRRRHGQSYAAMYTVELGEFGPPGEDLTYHLEWRDGQYFPGKEFQRLHETSSRRAQRACRSREAHGLNYPGKGSREVVEPGRIPKGAVQVFSMETRSLEPGQATPVLCRLPPDSTGEWLVENRPDPFIYLQVHQAVVDCSESHDQWVFLKNETHIPLNVYHGSYVGVAVPVRVQQGKEEVTEGIRRLVAEDDDGDWGLTPPEKPQPSWPEADSVISNLDMSYLPDADLDEGRIRSILQAHKEVVMRAPGDLGLLKMGFHDIELTNETPFTEPTRKLNPDRMKALKEIIDKGVSNGTFVRSSSAWASPIVLVKKRDGTLRLCVDYRTLNKRTKPDAYPLPRIDTILESCTGGRYFCTLDLGNAFWQVRMSAKAAEMAAFSTPLGLYQPVRMPMGPRNCPASFQRIMDLLTQQLDGVMSYVDDILVVGSTQEELYHRLDKLLERLVATGAKIRSEKCVFGSRKVDFLGFTISEDGMCPPEKHVAHIESIAFPKNLKELQRFLGCANYFRSLIANFAEMARPLTDLMRGAKKGVKITPNPELEAAHQSLKDAITAYPVLRFPVHSKPFILVTDASQFCVGAALMQRDDEGIMHACGYMSRRFSPTQERWDVTEKELYAMVSGFEHFQAHLLDKKDTVVMTDHRPLKALDSLRTSKPKIWRWLLYLEDFKPFHIEFSPGKENYVADLLSRDVACRTARNAPIIPDGMTMPLPRYPVLLPSTLIRAQQKDASLKPVFEALSKEEAESEQDKLYMDNYALHNGLLFGRPNEAAGPDLRRRVIIPDSIVDHVIEEAHATEPYGHVGAERLYRKLSQVILATNLQKRVAAVTKGCGTCAAYRSSALKYSDTQRKAVDKSTPDIFCGWSIDLAEFPHAKGGKTKYICVFVEWWTRWVEIVPIKDKSAASVCAALMSVIIPRFGCPDTILSDQGKEFDNKFVAEIFAATGCLHLMTTPYTPKSNGIVERKNKEIKNLLRRLSREDPTLWPSWIPLVSLLLNSTPPSRAELDKSPFYLMYGKAPRLPNPTQLDELVEITEGMQTKGRTGPQALAQVRQWAHDQLLKANNGRNEKHNDALPAQEWKRGDVVFMRVEGQDKMTAPAVGPRLVWAIGQSASRLALLDPKEPDKEPDWVAAERCSKVGFMALTSTITINDWAAQTLEAYSITEVAIAVPKIRVNPLQSRLPKRKTRNPTPVYRTFPAHRNSREMERQVHARAVRMTTPATSVMGTPAPQMGLSFNDAFLAHTSAINSQPPPPPPPPGPSTRHDI